MRLAKTLFTKCMRDLRRNFKQFISVIFIVAISCTLYIGLEANAQGFERRVNDVFNKGNLGDVRVTVNPDFNNFEQMDQDYKYLESISGEHSKLETRLYLPSNISSYSVTGLISDKLPKINTYSNLDAKNYSDRDFFFVDTTIIAKYKELTGGAFALGDSLPLSFQTDALKSMAYSVLENEETVKTLISSVITSLELSQNIKDLLKSILENNVSTVQQLLKTTVDGYLKEDTVQFEIPVNGVMSHPENIENGTFSTSSYLLSSRLLVATLFTDIAQGFEPQNLIKVFEELKSKYQDNQLALTLINQVLKYLNDPKNQATIQVVLGVVINDVVFAINHNSNEFIESFLTHFYNQVCIKVDPSIDTDLIINQINSYYKRKDTNNLLAVMDRDGYGPIMGVINDITQAQQLTFAFPIIFFVVAILIVLTTLGQLILRERTQIGTMKALGISKGKILSYYLLIMDIVCTLGLLIGSILGPAILPHVMNIKYTILYTIPSISFVFPWKVTLVVFAIIISLVSLLTYILIRKELSYSPSESMRVASPHMKLKATKKNIKNTSLMMTFRNIKVHMTKSIMVVIGVMGCTALLICGLGIDDTINYGKNLDIKNYLNSDISVSLNTGVQQGEAKEELEKIQGVELAEEYTISHVQVTGNNKSINTPLYFISMESNFYGYDDEYDGGHWDVTKVAITEQKAEKLGVKEGDRLSFVIDGKVKSFEIDKVFYAFSSNGVIIYNETIKDITLNPTNVWVNIKEGYNPQEVKELILESSKSIYSAMTYDENMERIDGYMSSVSQMTLTIKIFAILLAVVVLINLAILNFNERKRDIATLRVLGFSRFEIASSLIYEVMILTTLGALIGLAFGLPMEMLVLGINKVELIDWQYVIYPLTYVIAFFLSFLTAFIVNALISFKIDKISMSESLKSVE